MGVPELRRKKRRMARLLSPLSYTGCKSRLSILRQQKNYIWKRRTEASQKKGLFAERASSCVMNLIAFSNSSGHPCSDFGVRPRHVFSTERDLSGESFSAD